ncbi:MULTISPECIES: hypothetical protein [unclassified Myroides]|uniref:hypothetical protein n=1 Tax=unclassified Myroides TaxID=2642485 RepID=UPI0015FE56C3|nr:MULTISPECIES: hypothetical protein [unclassified Myroides]MBB1150613.1 hypothetical protein [Myroides sp. NP-2]MDM1407156.1 hypothetical protein [Myroides sp. DF42-4-2]
MKKILFLTFVLLFALGCSTDSYRSSNPYLPNQNVNLRIPLVLADNLNHPGGVHVDRSAQAGISGVAIYSRDGLTEYYSYELTCPNHEVQHDGSSVLIQDPKRPTYFYCNATHLHHGEKVYYNIALGFWGKAVDQNLEYTMKSYPTTREGGVVIVRY